MTQRMRVMTVFGTRPEAIKLAPVLAVLAENASRFESRVVVTAQHREMLDQVLSVFGIRPDHDLRIMRERQTLSHITTEALSRLGDVLDRERPDVVVVQGDTTTTFAAALAAFYARIPVGHVEAGLRTGDKLAPFPEEMNRRLVSALSDLHFAPTRGAAENLFAEGIDPRRVFVTGNTAVDALHLVLALGVPEKARVFVDDLPPGTRYLLVTAHRRESWGAPLRRICSAVDEILQLCPDLHAVFVVHKNPVVASAVHEVLGRSPRVRLVDAADYDVFVHLMAHARLILSDSGGVQEEAPSLGIPVLVLRDTTERPEGLAEGATRLVGTDESSIVSSALALLEDGEAYRAMSCAGNPYGDGRAARRIVERLGLFGSGRAGHPREQLTLAPIVERGHA